MKVNAEKYLFSEAVKYLGKYPATKKKIEEYLQKKIRNKKTYQKAVFPENIEKEAIIKNIVSKLDELKIINENDYLETMFHYYQKSSVVPGRMKICIQTMVRIWNFLNHKQHCNSHIYLCMNLLVFLIVMKRLS